MNDMQPPAREEFALKVSAAQMEREIPQHLAKATHGLNQRPTPKIHTHNPTRVLSQKQPTYD